jgi:tetratricopeptide (TPR) repeat protein
MPRKITITLKQIKSDLVLAHHYIEQVMQMSTSSVSTRLLTLITIMVVLSCSTAAPTGLTLEFCSDHEAKTIDIRPDEITQVRIRDDNGLFRAEIILDKKYHKMLEEMTRANLGKKVTIKSDAEVLYKGPILAPIQGGYIGLASSSKEQAEAIIHKLGRQAVYYSTKPTPKELEEARARTESTKDPWVDKAIEADMHGDYEKAEEYARKAIELNPEKPTPHDFLGIIYHHQGRKALALQEALTAEKLSTEEDLRRFPGTYLTIGQFYSELKEYDKAIEYYKKVLAAYDGNLLAHEGLANVYEKMRMTDLATEEYRILEESQSEYFRKQGSEGIKRLKMSPSEK